MNYSISDLLTRLFLWPVFFLPMCLYAQQASDTIGYSEFRFTIADVQGKELTPDKITARISNIFLTDTAQNDHYAVARIEYSIKDSCWILSQYDPMGYNYEIEVFRNSDTVNLRLLELRKMVITYHGYNQATGEGCKFCICNNIPLQKGHYVIDMPRKPESWGYLRRLYINVRNFPTEFRDISQIQNWAFRSGK